MLGLSLETTACTVYACLFFHLSSVIVNVGQLRPLSWLWQNYSSPQKRKEEKSEPSEKDDKGKEVEGDVGDEGQGDESSEDSSKSGPAKEEEKETPAKKPRINPYGVWEQIQEEEDP